MDDFDIPIVWECIAQNEQIEKEDLEEETGLDVLKLLAIIQKFKYYELVFEEKEGAFVYFTINKKLTTYQVSRANNLGINMDLLEAYCSVCLESDYEILDNSLEFDDIDERKRTDIETRLKNQRRSKKIEQLKDSKKDLINLLGITEDLMGDEKFQKSRKSNSIKVVNEKLNNILNKMVD